MGGIPQKGFALPPPGDKAPQRAGRFNLLFWRSKRFERERSRGPPPSDFQGLTPQTSRHLACGCPYFFSAAFTCSASSGNLHINSATESGGQFSPARNLEHSALLSRSPSEKRPCASLQQKALTARRLLGRFEVRASSVILREPAACQP